MHYLIALGIMKIDSLGMTSTCADCLRAFTGGLRRKPQYKLSGHPLGLPVPKCGSEGEIVGEPGQRRFFLSLVEAKEGREENRLREICSSDGQRSTVLIC